MRALTWHGTHDVRVETMPDPGIVNPRDAVIEVTSTAICGSDLHLYDGVIPGMHGRRHPRPRVHGRGGRGRAEEHAEEGAAGGGALHHLLRQLLLLRASSSSRPATTRTRSTSRT